MIKIKEIKKDSIAERIGIRPGSELMSINGNEINDPLDLRFFESEDTVDLIVCSGNQERIYHIEKEEHESLGIRPSELTMKYCNNRCTFCFIDQNPPDARETLLIKDDDYRMSFLYGNYITLTNLKEEEFERIIELKLSPLFISVHSTNPEKRREIMKNPAAGLINKHIMRLVEGGINLHTQIVLIPGINDGEVLQETVEDLLSMYPSVLSIGIVPVGLTDYRDNLPHIRRPDSVWMKEIIDLIEPYQIEMRDNKSNTVVYLADEFYLKTGTAIPDMEHYDDFSQLENGIGMVRRFLNGLEAISIPPLDGRVLMVTGIIAVDIVERLAEKFRENNIQTDVIAVRNRYFGESVEVASLLGGWDLLGRISISESKHVILPPDIINSDGLFIDGCSIELFRKNLHREIHIAPYNVIELENIK